MSTALQTLPVTDALCDLAAPYRDTSYQSDNQKPCLYWGSTASSQHIAPDTIRDADRLRKLALPLTSYWFEPVGSNDWKDLDTLVFRIGKTIKYAPAQIDYAFHVDDGGATHRHMQEAFSTRWIAVETGQSWRRTVYVRLSQARTARHGNGILRSPIDGNGFALELTDRPDSTDPCHAVTLFVFTPKSDADPQRSWIKARDARVFDLRDHVAQPYFVGPLFSGFPNEVGDTELMHMIKRAVRTVIMRTIRD